MFFALPRPIRRLMAICCPIACLAQPTAPQTTDLFVPGQDGIAFYRIPGIVVTQHGVLLAYAEGRKNDRADWGELEIFLRRSVDQGNP
jgi:sialidase-1